MGGKGKSRKNVKVRKVPKAGGREAAECGCGPSGSHHHPLSGSKFHSQGGNPNGSLKKLPISHLPGEISILDLSVDEYHENRVLSGTFCVDPFVINCVHTVLEDKFGNMVRVLIYDEGVTVSKQSVARYSKGRNVHILGPYYKTCLDGGTAVRVDDPQDIRSGPIEEEKRAPFARPAKDVPPKPPKPEMPISSSVEADRIRCEGNRVFSKQDWKGAITLYTQCIAECLELCTGSTSGHNSVAGVGANGMTSVNVDGGKLKDTLLLAYSNRAETWLRLRNYDESLSDASKALELDFRHVKSLVRKGKALHELQQYEQAAACFSSALQESPDDPSIQAALSRSRISSQQADQGNYDLSEFYLSSCAGPPPPCADFVGAVEIRRPENGRRGLFATKDAAAGELLLVSNAIAIHRQERLQSDSEDEEEFCGSCQACEHNAIKGFGTRNLHSVDELADQLKIFSNSSKRRLHQVCTLAGTSPHCKLDIPSMDLFRPNQEWSPPSSENLKLSFDSVREIVMQNSVEEILNDARYFSCGDSEQMLSALWLLPSLMNHSCCANAETWLIGDVMFVRACKAISSGEEVTRSYFDTLKSLERRQESARKWSFKCTCQRCDWESNIPESQYKVRKRLCNRVQKFYFEAYASPYAPNLEKLASVVTSVEEAIESVKLEGKFGLWIRASLMEAYIAKVHVLVGIPTRRIEALRTVLSAMLEVGGGFSLRPQIASTLLREVRRKYGKSSPLFRSTEAYVMEIYQPFYGNLNKKAFWTLAKMNAGGDGWTETV